MVGFQSLNPSSTSGAPMPGPAQQGKPGSDMIRLGQFSTGPQAPAPAVKAPMPYGQANDPAAYGTPGAPPASPLGMWQSWLNSMGPMLAQMPNSQPGADTQAPGSLNSAGTGLSNLAPSPTSLGTAGYYGAGVGPGFGNRGFRMLALQ